MKLTLTDIIKRASLTHKNKYDYSKSVYTGINNVMEIICPLHGPFWQRPSDHSRGQNCPACAKEDRAAHFTSDKEKFIKKAVKIHGAKYVYDSVVYIKSNIKIKIICPTHGIFEQTPNKHLMGQGCSSCVGKKSLTQQEFIDKANRTHNFKYEYSLVKYTGIDTLVDVICPIHGKYKVSPYHHLKGGQCSSCASYGFKYNQPAILYYVKIVMSDKAYYKVGITNRAVKERFSLPEFKSMEVLKITNFSSGREAYVVEQQILQKFKQFIYSGSKLLNSNGNTEIFIEDVLKLDSNHS